MVVNNYKAINGTPRVCCEIFKQVSVFVYSYISSPPQLLENSLTALVTGMLVENLLHRVLNACKERKTKLNKY